MTDMLLEHDESVDAAYPTVSDAPWHHQVKLEDVTRVMRSPRVMRSVGFRVLDRPRPASVSGSMPASARTSRRR